MIVVLMGVAGSGKSTVGRLLAARLGWPFYDGDDLHTPEMIGKMKSNRPLTDQDRAPWLDRIAAIIEHLDRGARAGVIACSALTGAYRQTLAARSSDIVFVHLKGSYELIHDRIVKRKGHFLKAELLENQFKTLEEPDQALTMDIRFPPEMVVERIIRELGL